MNCLKNLWQKTVLNKNFIAEESPFFAEQNGEICFRIGYFIYEICGIKHMHVVKAAFCKNICMNIINIGLIGLNGTSH